MYLSPNPNLKCALKIFFSIPTYPENSNDMDLDEMFWAYYFGSFIDKFGIRWMSYVNQD